MQGTQGQDCVAVSNRQALELSAVCAESNTYFPRRELYSDWGFRGNAMNSQPACFGTRPRYAGCLLSAASRAARFCIPS